MDAREIERRYAGSRTLAGLMRLARARPRPRRGPAAGEAGELFAAAVMRATASKVTVVAFTAFGCVEPKPEDTGDTAPLVCTDTATLPEPWDRVGPCGDDDVAAYWRGTFELADGELYSATFRYGLFDACSAEWLCVIEGQATPVSAAAGCPECEWAFELAPVRDSVATGASCAALGIEDGALDGFLGYPWGFEAYSGFYYRDWSA